jgi:hypothetical protein
MSQRLTLEQAKQNCIGVHGDRYDYTLWTVYSRAIDKVPIICKEHGLFHQSYHKHRNAKHGCPVCARNQPLDPVQALDELKQIHPEYDYSKAVYTSVNNKITVICPEHGEFYPYYNPHIRGTKCPKCMGVRKLTQDECVAHFRTVWGDTYDYSQVKYVRQIDHVTIVCPKHGPWRITPNNHKRGYGCPKCNTSKGERAVAQFLTANHISHKHQATLPGMVHKTQLYCDFHLPDLNTVIEFNGRQHYEVVPDFGGVGEFEKIKARDKAKVAYCEEHNIRLITIHYKDNVEDVLRHWIFGT